MWARGFKAERGWLLEGIELHVLAAFAELGFARVEPTPEDKRSSEIRRAFPFGQLRRPRGSGIDLVEVQLDKRGRPAFRVNFGATPESGVDHHLVGHIPAEDVWVHYLDRSFALYARSFLHKWFAVSRWRRAPTVDDYRALTSSIAQLVGQVDDMLSKESAART
jgi:hypothetical protein